MPINDRAQKGTAAPSICVTRLRLTVFGPRAHRPAKFDQSSRWCHEARGRIAGEGPKLPSAKRGDTFIDELTIVPLKDG